MHKVIIIKKDEQQQANEYCNTIGAEGDTFTVKLYKDGTHSHYICSWLVTSDQATKINNYFTHVFDDAENAIKLMNLNKLEEQEE